MLVHLADLYDPGGDSMEDLSLCEIYFNQQRISIQTPGLGWCNQNIWNIVSNLREQKQPRQRRNIFEGDKFSSITSLKNIGLIF